MIQKNQPSRKDAEGLSLGYFEAVCQPLYKCAEIPRRHFNDLGYALICQTVNQFHSHDTAVTLRMDMLGNAVLNF